ncbi:MAG TPA: PQQ-dependent sugar dehydrogenase [Anaerolineales bacterium]|nr:PQQ-dependent sugar dehydrogenase [Anaerolineales bacterium]
MKRLFTLFLWFIVLVLVTACGGADNQISQTPTPTNFSSSEILPTATLLPPEPSAVIQTKTATTPPAHPPTIIPTLNRSYPTQFPDPEQYGWKLIVSGLNRPIGLVHAGDGSDRLFVLEQSGMILVIRDNDLLAEPFLDITGLVSCCGERGLLGLVFHPQYSENGYFFVNYTDINGDTVIARYEVSEDPAKANPASEEKLLVVEQPYANHNGGDMKFGPDSYLYVSLGDGGSGGDPLGNAQNKSVLLGKLLRLDVDQVDGYAIPPDNPFVGGGAAPEVWVVGLRNPWRISFDRLTGDLFIGDVGQGSWEEIDFLPAGHPGGANFGWNYREGSHAFGAILPPGDLGLTDPVAEYGRDQGFTVIGGVVYRGEEFPEWNGIYIYGDYGSGYVWGLYPSQDGSWQNRLLFQADTPITSFGEDERGEIYFVDQNGGLYQLVDK